MPCHVSEILNYSIMLFILLLNQCYPKNISFYVVPPCCIHPDPSHPFPTIPFIHFFFWPHDTSLMALPKLVLSHLVTNPCPSFSHCPNMGTSADTGLEPTTLESFPFFYRSESQRLEPFEPGFLLSQIVLLILGRKKHWNGRGIQSWTTLHGPRHVQDRRTNVPRRVQTCR